MHNDNRPLSPHLFIYRPQLTAMLSIIHRGTGAALSGGALLLVIWLLALAASPEAYALTMELLGHWLGLLVLLGITWMGAYHFCNGIRHLVWDTGRCLELSAVYRGGWLVIVMSMILTGLLWGIAFAAMEGS
ncbi:succinate dehydrogenase, cytochrome b556 subunit [Halorhodospira abdelmalekii]|uniref:succinate dehydrogenase, cytochrome b556 subunit n=1 Tax=Halorhodospira abdelmalekii TaxID=421629 RepID=UPI0019051FE8|nr:succinate dehydrogenase, cytochrome b556 subunit [Halorhodospira abdelmalekii]MBK1735454.1 succinate dehydrogenase, cytochrome b556 subunit [Halorhodospira abdelmalekii]